MRAVPSGSDLPEALDTRDRPLTRTAPSGVRSGALLAAASVVAVGLNYVFLLAAGRLLGSDDYGAFAALLGLLTVILLPTGAVQLAVSREVSRRIALGDADGADAFMRATLRLGLLLTAPLVAVALVLAIPLRELLDIQSTTAVVLAASGLVVALAFPIAMGALQGYQRFHAVAALYVTPFATRLALLAVVAAAGYRLGGAVLAAIAGGLVATAVAVVLLRDPLRRSAQAVRPALGGFLRYLWPVVVGLIGIAVLTNVDLLVVKARFSDDAGEYAAASAFARVAFFLPATILAVLFPRTAARQARGEETSDILGRSLLVTAAFGALLTLFYAMTGRGLVHTSFGAEFAEGGELLVPFTVSMALFALANVLVGFHLSRDETRYAWIVAAAVPAQLVLLTLVPDSVREVIWIDVLVGIALLACHELFVESSVPALRAGLGRLQQAVWVRRRHLVEALVATLAATALVCLLFWRLVSDIGSAAIGGEGSDAAGTIGWLWRLQHEGYHLFGTTVHQLTGAPIGWEEGNGLNLQWLLPYYPAYLATKVVDEVVAYNLVVLTGYVLSGVTMYLLARYLECSRLVAAWAGLVFIVFPWHLERAEHASLVHLELLVLLLLALVAAADRPIASRFVLVGLATLAGWLTSGYFGVMAVVGACAFAVAAALLGGSGNRFRLVAGTAATALAATAVLGIGATTSGVGTGAGLEREVDDLSVYGLRPSELVVSSEDNLFVGSRLASHLGGRLHGSTPTETSNYLGLLTIGLAVAWIVLAWRRRASLGRRARVATAGFSGVVVAALAFAAPSPVGVLGHLWSWGPSRVLWELVPAFRVPSRWTALVMTALVPLAALGLQAAASSFGRRAGSAGGARLAQGGLVAAAMLVSFSELAVDPGELLLRTRPVPPQYEALSATPAGPLAVYPLGQPTTYFLWQRAHERPLVNGPGKGSLADDVRLTLVDPGAPGTAERLALLGVTSIVTWPDALDFEEQTAPDLPNARWGPGYSLVERFPDGSSVWRVTAEPAPALVTLRHGFGEPVPPEPGAEYAPVGVVGYPLASPSGVGTIELTARKRGVVRLVFDAVPPEDGQMLVLADSGTKLPFTLEGRTRVSALVEVPRGRSRLLVKARPAPAAEEDAVLLYAPRAEEASGPADLRAIPISADPGL